jgi:hypothetical protein
MPKNVLFADHHGRADVPFLLEMDVGATYPRSSNMDEDLARTGNELLLGRRTGSNV